MTQFSIVAPEPSVYVVVWPTFSQITLYIQIHVFCEQTILWRTCLWHHNMHALVGRILWRLQTYLLWHTLLSWCQWYAFCALHTEMGDCDVCTHIMTNTSTNILHNRNTCTNIIQLWTYYLLNMLCYWPENQILTEAKIMIDVLVNQ
jgi:hypothetical protein